MVTNRSVSADHVLSDITYRNARCDGDVPISGRDRCLGATAASQIWRGQSGRISWLGLRLRPVVPGGASGARR
jgi:hypothetical protein